MGCLKKREGGWQKNNYAQTKPRYLSYLLDSSHDAVTSGHSCPQCPSVLRVFLLHPAVAPCGLGQMTSVGQAGHQHERGRVLPGQQKCTGLFRAAADSFR